jgi:hypothetical protein
MLKDDYKAQMIDAKPAALRPTYLSLPWWCER